MKFSEYVMENCGLLVDSDNASLDALVLKWMRNDRDGTSVCDCHNWASITEMHEYLVTIESKLFELFKELNID